MTVLNSNVNNADRERLVSYSSGYSRMTVTIYIETLPGGTNDDLEIKIACAPTSILSARYTVVAACASLITARELGGTSNGEIIYTDNK